MNINGMTMPLSNQLSINTKKTDNVEGSFKNMLSDALTKVNDDLLGAEKLTQDFALGKDVELHQVVTATEQASLALQLTIQIRNKVQEAYQEIMRMQL